MELGTAILLDALNGIANAMMSLEVGGMGKSSYLFFIGNKTLQE